MSRELSPKLLEILKTTLDEVERSFHSPNDEAAVRELKQSVTIAVGELERQRKQNQDN